MSPDEDDLPDIIDVVMEMGRADEPAERPSPPLLAVANSRLPAHLDALADRARDYVEAASSANTRRAYASDWKHFASWCRRQGVDMFPPDPQVVGLYITACASGTSIGDRKPNSVSTIERRLSSLTWNYGQRGQPLDRKDRHIATVMAGIRNKHAAPPRQKEAVLPEDLIVMLETLDRGTLRGLRDRAMLLLGFCRRSSALRGRRSGRRPRPDRRWPRLGRNPRQGHALAAAWQDRLAGGRNRTRFIRRNLPFSGARDLAPSCTHRPRAPVPTRHWPRQGG